MCSCVWNPTHVMATMFCHDTNPIRKVIYQQPIEISYVNLTGKKKWHYKNLRVPLNSDVEVDRYMMWSVPWQRKWDMALPLQCDDTSSCTISFHSYCHLRCNQKPKHGSEFVHWNGNKLLPSQNNYIINAQNYS